METIQKHIEDDRKKIGDPFTSPHSRRHYKEELEQLEKYHERHPEDSHDPTPLELFCDANPGALECRVYED